MFYAAFCVLYATQKILNTHAHCPRTFYACVSWINAWSTLNHDRGHDRIIAKILKEEEIDRERGGGEGERKRERERERERGSERVR